jgi:hypothetical protein
MLLTYSGNVKPHTQSPSGVFVPAGSDPVHLANVASVAACSLDGLFDWVIDSAPFTQNAIDLAPKIGEDITLKIASGISGAGVIALGTVEGIRKGSFTYPWGVVKEAIILTIRLSVKYAQPIPGIGRRAKGHALFRV